MRITIHGVALNTTGHGYIEIANVRENGKRIRMAPTGVTFRTQAEAIRITTTKNEVEAARIRT